MKLFHISLDKERMREAADLCTQLYEAKLITKQNISRGLVRLCVHFEELVELDNPRGAVHLLGLITLLS